MNNEQKKASLSRSLTTLIGKKFGTGLSKNELQSDTKKLNNDQP